jgi:hypothetical protein
LYASINPSKLHEKSVPKAPRQETTYSEVFGVQNWPGTRILRFGVSRVDILINIKWLETLPIKHLLAVNLLDNGRRNWIFHCEQLSLNITVEKSLFIFFKGRFLHFGGKKELMVKFTAKRDFLQDLRFCPHGFH